MAFWPLEVNFISCCYLGECLFMTFFLFFKLANLYVFNHVEMYSLIFAFL